MLNMPHSGGIARRCLTMALMGFVLQSDFFWSARTADTKRHEKFCYPLFMSTLARAYICDAMLSHTSPRYTIDGHVREWE